MPTPLTRRPESQIGSARDSGAGGGRPRELPFRPHPGGRLVAVSGPWNVDHRHRVSRCRAKRGPMRPWMRPGAGRCKCLLSVSRFRSGANRARLLVTAPRSNGARCAARVCLRLRGCCVRGCPARPRIRRPFKRCGPLARPALGARSVVLGRVVWPVAGLASRVWAGCWAEVMFRGFARLPLTARSNGR
jgi:hypothetical protein